MAITGSTDLGDGLLVLTVDHDPKTIATDAPAGSLIITASGAWYRKDTSGSNTNVSLIRNAPGVSTGHVDFESANKEGSTIQLGHVVTSHSSGSGVVLADATGVGSAAEGLVQGTAVASLAVARIQTEGMFELSDWTLVAGAVTLAAKAKYFLSETPGMITAVPPVGAGKIVQVFGKAVSPSTLRIEIEDPVLLA